jgi:endonuclease YncB( thermonuclease family)
MRRTTFAIAVAVVFNLIFQPSSWAWSGKVVGVRDGDTIEVLRGRQAKRVRLYGVDTPETGQDYGQRAKQFTSRMVFGKRVEVDTVDTDQYGRVVALVKTDGRVLNEELVRAGLAWVYVYYCDRPECSEWLRLEEEARNGKRGLWSMRNPVPPWDYRHNSSEGSLTVSDWLRHYLWSK